MRTERQKERQRDRETERQRDRETERQRDRETERQRDRETERQRKTCLQIYESDTGVPRSRARRCAQNPVHAEEGVQKRHWSLKRRHAASRGKVAPPEGKGPFSGHDARWLGLAQTLATTVQTVDGAPSTERGHSWPGRGVSRFATLSRTSMPSFEGFPGQSRRSFRFTHVLYPAHLTQTTTPPWWKILCPMWTLIAASADAMHSFAPDPRSRRPLATYRSRARRSRIGSRRLLDQICSTAGRGKPRPAAGMKGAYFACHGMHDVGNQTHNCILPQTRKRLVHLTGASPAPSHYLMLGHPDAFFQRCTLPRDCSMGHLNGLVGWYCSAMCKVRVATHLCASWLNS